MVRGFSRRAILIGTATLSGGAALGLISVSDVHFLKAMLRRLLGNFQMREDDFADFAADFKVAFPDYVSVRIRIAELGRTAPILLKLAPARYGVSVELFERRVLTNFMLTTNFLTIKDSTLESVDYYGQQQACNNPFARFETNEIE